MTTWPLQIYLIGRNNQPLLNSTMPLITIHVTNEDILAGKQGSCQFCPVALAVKRATNKSHVEVGIDGICFYDKPIEELSYADIRNSVQIPISKEVEKFIVYFDEKYQVEPFSFELELPTTN
jgi:hypothetical protein